MACGGGKLRRGRTFSTRSRSTANPAGSLSPGPAPIQAVTATAQGGGAAAAGPWGDEALGDLPLLGAVPACDGALTPGTELIRNAAPAGTALIQTFGLRDGASTIDTLTPQDGVPIDTFAPQDGISTIATLAPRAGVCAVKALAPRVGVAVIAAVARAPGTAFAGHGSISDRPPVALIRVLMVATVSCAALGRSAI